MAAIGEDLTGVVVGDDERHPVPNPLESVRRSAARYREKIVEEPLHYRARVFPT